MKYLIISFIVFTTIISAQDNLKFELSPGKYLLVKGYTLEEDTLVARSPDKEKDTAGYYNQGHGIGQAIGQRPPAHVPSFFNQDDVSHQKKGRYQQAYVKGKGHDGHPRMPAHIFSGKGGAPAQNGTQTVF